MHRIMDNTLKKHDKQIDLMNLHKSIALEAQKHKTMVSHYMDTFFKIKKGDYWMDCKFKCSIKLFFEQEHPLETKKRNLVNAGKLTHEGKLGGQL